MNRGVRAYWQLSKPDIDRVFQKAIARKHSNGLLILRAPRTLSFGRILVITPKKVGNAPERNRIKRRIKALFYEKRLFERAYDAVVLVRPEAKSVTFEQLSTLLVKEFNKTPPIRTPQ